MPIGTDLPKARVAFMLKDSQAKALLTDTTTFDKTKEVSIAVENVKLINYLNISSKEIDVKSFPRNTQDLAYVIYTSGSTGNPKGVMIEHQNLVHSTMARFSYYPEPLGCYLLLSSFTFDSSVAGVFWTLVSVEVCCYPPKIMHKISNILAS